MSCAQPRLQRGRAHEHVTSSEALRHYDVGQGRKHFRPKPTNHAEEAQLCHSKNRFSTNASASISNISPPNCTDEPPEPRKQSLPVRINIIREVC